VPYRRQRAPSQFIEDPGRHRGMLVVLERRAGEVVAPDPPGARRWRCRITGRSHECGLLHPCRRILVLAHAAKQDGIQADTLAQGR
jgi:hypothetical protein